MEGSIKHKGCWIYNPQSKLDLLKTRQLWTVHQLRRFLKCSYGQASLIIDYAQQEKVIGFGRDRYGRYSVI